ncbi:uncharacterized protein LOC124283757 [Haliotis rubra]|uniref:uncharacterized protein LOC124283757 n=1 Tax=Haliotis rubra TaxID=36100 RepID=UPI001EE5003E|nr:uncharacterized protein LOC124283757 [Haliotis rubra]
MSQDVVKVVFKLYHLPDSIEISLKDDKGRRNAVNVALLGSIHGLGRWKLEKQLVAKPSVFETDVWEVTAELPVSSSFEWSWLVADDTKVFYWDPAYDRRTRLSYHDGVMHTSWGRDPNYFVSQTCALKLETHYYCGAGEALAVVGSEPCLGSWKSKKALMAHEYPEKSGHWRANTLLDVHRDYQWKWAVVDVKTHKVKRWEECPNRFISTNCDQLSIRAPWNKASSILSHSSTTQKQMIDMAKVAKFYDAVENCDELVKSEMISSWQTPQETSKKPFVITEMDKKTSPLPATVSTQMSQQKVKSHKSFLRKVPGLVCHVAKFLSDCYHSLV